MSFLMETAESDDEPITINRASKSKRWNVNTPKAGSSVQKSFVIKGSSQLDVTPLHEIAAGSSSQLLKRGPLREEKIVSSTTVEYQSKKRLMDELEQTLNKEIESQKKTKSDTFQEKANNLEFLKVMSLEISGENLVPYNESYEVVWLKKDG